MSLKELREEIEREFEKEFNQNMAGSFKEFKANYPTLYYQVILPFISSALDRQLSEIIKIVEETELKDNGIITMEYANGNKYDYEVPSDKAVFYNQALSDLLAKINEDGK